MILGHRARIGYTSPPMLTEVFPYEFYRVVPDGVTLVLTTLAIREYKEEEVRESYDRALRAAREMAKEGVSVVILGGSPINISLGVEKVEGLRKGMEEELGIPVSLSVLTKVHAMEKLGARKVGVVHHFPDASNSAMPFRTYVEYFGYEVTGLKGTGLEKMETGSLSTDLPVELARQLMREHPETDTLYFPSPHWAVSDSIDLMEKEFGVNVVGSLQAIVWEALRLSGINDRIEGYGRLLREF